MPKLVSNMPEFKTIAPGFNVINTFRGNLNLSQNDNDVRRNHPFVKKSLFLIGP